MLVVAISGITTFLILIAIGSLIAKFGSLIAKLKNKK